MKTHPQAKLVLVPQSGNSAPILPVVLKNADLATVAPMCNGGSVWNVMEAMASGLWGGSHADLGAQAPLVVVHMGGEFDEDR